MSLTVLIVAEFVLWVFMNRNTPFSTARLTVLRDVSGYAAVSTGGYVALSYVFMPFTLLDPFQALLFTFGNTVLWVIIAVRQHSVAYQH